MVAAQYCGEMALPMNGEFVNPSGQVEGSNFQCEARLAS